MKIFEYSFKTGKGKLVADRHFGGTGQRIGRKDEYTVSSCIGLYECGCHSSYTAEEFTTTDAICCCPPKIVGEDWEWYIIPTKEIVEKAQKRNLKMYGTKYTPK